MRAGSSKKKAVADALFRLGMHARAEAVVQALAEQGITVNEALVTLVRLELLKKDTARRPQSEGVRRVGPATVRCGPRTFPSRNRHR